MMTQKVLVTGAAGFIGSKVAHSFLEKNYDVVGWDCVCPGRDYEICLVDMFDGLSVIDSLKNNCPDVIIHCAGSADVGRSVMEPEKDYSGNVTTTHNLLFAIHKLGLGKCRLVFLSSAGVYGNPSVLPVTEELPKNPLSPYALHKLMCEEICSYFVRNYQMNVKIARIFSAYGAGLKKQIFWDMYRKYKLTGRLDMFGTGTESRDYIHVDDVIQAIYLLATTNSDGIIYNVANGEETTIRTATELFAESIGAPLDSISFNGAVREGDPINWRADISKISAIGYKKTVDLKSGITDYVNWASKQEI